MSHLNRRESLHPSTQPSAQSCPVYNPAGWLLPRHGLCGGPAAVLRARGARLPALLPPAQVGSCEKRTSCLPPMPMAVPLSCHTVLCHTVHSSYVALSHRIPPPPLAARSTSGPNLRRFYLPGLEGLKSELRKLDFLLERYLPALTAHLNVRRCACSGCHVACCLVQCGIAWCIAAAADLAPRPVHAKSTKSLTHCPVQRLSTLCKQVHPSSPTCLQAAGVVPVLFASQWLLTCFSCPFPVGFACRLVDVMLQVSGRVDSCIRRCLLPLTRAACWPGAGRA